MAKGRKKAIEVSQVEEAGSAKVEHMKKLAQEPVPETKILEKKCFVDGDKIKQMTLTETNGVRRKYTEYIGSKKKHPEQYKMMIEKGLLPQP